MFPPSVTCLSGLRTSANRRASRRSCRNSPAGMQTTAPTPRVIEALTFNGNSIDRAASSTPLVSHPVVEFCRLAGLKQLVPRLTSREVAVDGKLKKSAANAGPFFFGAETGRGDGPRRARRPRVP